MPLEMGLWRVDGEKLHRVPVAMLPQEKELEDLLVADPDLLGTPMLIIGRQVLTKQGKFIDLLGVDGDGVIHVLELKRDKTPRDVVAQVLDYAQWVSTLDRDAILDLAKNHLGRDLAEAFSETFGGESLPEELNARQEALVVASQLDDSSERIVTYLRGFGVPINAVFFSHLEDDGRRYVARSWLVEDEQQPIAHSKASRTRAEWNGVDWYVSFGEEGGERSWADARRLGFVSAGGGHFYTSTIRKLPIGARVNVAVPGHGYVGVGEVTGPPMRFDQAALEFDGQTVSLAQESLVASYRHEGDSDDHERAEWVVPVAWAETTRRILVVLATPDGLDG